mmetsp:Transcript_1020/g.1678  ORF Transcript_1020/g.1678 Transcript_1020/m.1678 type:complete len:728 (-) Transcript_1020:134-2317(-)
MLQSNPHLEHFRLIKRAVGLTCNELKDDAARQLMVTSVREGVVVINREPVTVRRVYVSTEASNRLMDVGWVLHEGLPCCLSCHVNFTVLSRKHHCRACGSLICKQCSTLATLIGFSTLPAQIVCKTCNPQSARRVKLHDLTKWGTQIYKTPGAVARRPSNADFASLARDEVIASPMSIDAIPTPGYVIKTRRTSLPEVKIFVNVFHSESVKDTHLMLTYVPPGPEKQENVVDFSLRLPQQQSTTHSGRTVVSPSGQNTFRSVSYADADTPRTAENAPRYASMSSDKRRAHAYSNYNSYVRYKANGSPESTGSISPHQNSTNTNNANNMNLHTVSTSPEGITSKEGFSPDSNENLGDSDKIYPLVTPLVYVGTTTTANDKNGHAAMVYNVLISSEYFRTVVANNTQHCSATYGRRVLITNQCAVNKIIQVINQHFHHDLQETSYILPKVRRSFKGALDPVSKPVLYNRTLCSVICNPESECMCTSEHLRSSSGCSDFSGSGLTAMLGAESIDTHDAPTNTHINRISPVHFPEAQAELSQPSPLPSNAATSRAVSPTTTRKSPTENSERAANLFLSMRLSTTSVRSAAPEKPSSWYSKTGAFSSVYLRQFTVHSRDLYTQLTPELMQLKPQFCMSVEASDELKRQSVYDPTVLLGYQIICPFSQQANQSILADQSLVYIITDLRRNSHFHTEYKLSQFALTEKSKWERLQRSDKKLGVEFRITFQSIVL